MNVKIEKIININTSDILVLSSMPKIFSKVMLAGEIPEEEMKNVFNLGIGYCLVVPDEAVVDTQLIIEGNGLKSWVIAETK